MSLGRRGVPAFRREVPERRGGPDYDSPLWPFVGRSDVFAEQSSTGAYYPVQRPLTTEDLAEHVAGNKSIGTYVITPPDQVSFVVFDLDSMDPDKLAWLKSCVEFACDPLADEYPYLLLEKSGGKGFHIWLFLDQPAPAFKVRAWLEERFWPKYGDPDHGQVDSLGRALEVFPKQDRVSEGGYGNLVKVPLGVHRVSGKRSEIVGCRGWCSETSSRGGFDTGEFPDVAPPQAPEVINASTPTGILLSDGLVGRFVKGETEPGTRNHTFHAFFTWTAWNLHLPSDLAWEWCQRLNEALDDPEEDEVSIQRTMESAYRTPPADAANPRPQRGQDQRTDDYRSVPYEERLASLRKEGGS